MLKKSFLTFLVLLPLAFPCGAAQSLRVKYVVDGDTLILENHEKVRLIGVDTPEVDDKWGRNIKDAERSHRDVKIINEYALRAKSFLNNLLRDKTVDMEMEPGNASIGHKDKYGRTLAYLYRPPDHLFINAELIKQGYGFAYTRFPFKYAEDFRRYEKEARDNKKGLWADL